MKTKLKIGLALATMVVSTYSLAGETPREIAETTAAQWNAAFAKGQVEAILPLYADNAMLLLPNGEVSKGTAQIRSFWQTILPKGAFALDIIDVRGEQDGSIVTTSRISDVNTPRDRQQHVMKYQYGGVLYSVLKRQADGSWKAQVQRWNNDKTA